jgi:hypothetical protein
MDGEEKDSARVETAPFKPEVPRKPPETLSRERTSGLAVASMVLGIAGLVICPLIGALVARDQAEG